jgi:hypothetical protein
MNDDTANLDTADEEILYLLRLQRRSGGRDDAA